ncbi:MAG: glutathione S-transferase family protein [Gaiellales bacterium]
MGLRLYAVPLSTNVERVALALGHKGVEADLVMLDVGDRSAAVEISGQPLVPVLDDDGWIVIDSSEIIEHLERRFPTPPLFPAEASDRARVRVFIDWFNRVWKRPPNEIEAELSQPQPDEGRVLALAAEMRSSLDLFEDLLSGRDHLMGDDFSAADCCAFPFLKYGRGIDPADDELFHRVLAEHLALDAAHPRLAEWLERVDQRPRIPARAVAPV